MGEQANEPTQFKVDIPNVEISLDAGDVARAMSPSDVVNLVIELDAEVGEWEATLLLYHYFKGQYELAKATGAVPHLVDATEDVLWDSLFTEQAMQVPDGTEGMVE